MTDEEFYWGCFVIGIFVVALTIHAWRSGELENWFDGKPMERPETKTCSECREEIKYRAKRCPYCTSRQ